MPKVGMGGPGVRYWDGRYAILRTQRIDIPAPARAVDSPAANSTATDLSANRIVPFEARDASSNQSSAISKNSPRTDAGKLRKKKKKKKRSQFELIAVAHR